MPLSVLATSGYENKTKSQLSRLTWPCAPAPPGPRLLPGAVRVRRGQNQPDIWWQAGRS